MTTHSPLVLLAALGLLCHAGTAFAQDTSKWTCESCPYPKGVTGSVEAGVAAVTDESARFGDYTGMDRRGGHLVVGGGVRWNPEEGGAYATLNAADLGLRSRELAAEAGMEGRFSVRLGYAEIPRRFEPGATPFAGAGTDVQTLPAGFRAATTAGMPLASTLQPVKPGFDKKRLDLSGRFIGLENWTYGVKVTRDQRDGTRPMYASFFSSASQLVAPVDQVTDQIEVYAAYTTRRLQASLAYQVSRFSNGPDSLTWDNPFQEVALGATRGQMALAPDNQMHQVVASLGWQPSAKIRASADVAYGRSTQDQGYLAPTLNPTLLDAVTFTAVTAPALPAASLDGRADHLNANVKVSAQVMDDLRVNATAARDVRENKTPRNAYSLIATDIFLNPGTRANTPFSWTHDRVKVNADYRGFEGVKLTGGIDQDWRRRTYHEVVTTAETQGWVRAGLQPREDLGITVKLAIADRNNSTYGTAIWFGALDNPLLRKYHLADRRRATAGVRADYSFSETVSFGATFDVADDDYDESVLGLTEARSASLGFDVAATLAESTQVTAFVQSESIRSRQVGSESQLGPDWTARNKDRFHVLGVGVKHAFVADKFNVGADLAFARSRSDLRVDTAVAGAPPYPANKTAQDTLKVYANYKLRDKLWLNGSFWYERYDADDWRWDGVAPNTVPNLLSLGQATPQYNVGVVSVSLRYQF